MVRRTVVGVGFGIAVLGSLAFVVRYSFAQGVSANGEGLYNKHCKICHAADGSGKKDGAPLKIAATMKVEPERLNLLTDNSKKMGDADMEKVLLQGKEKMKGLKEKMSAEEAKIVVKYVRDLQNAKK